MPSVRNSPAGNTWRYNACLAMPRSRYNWTTLVSFCPMDTSASHSLSSGFGLFYFLNCSRTPAGITCFQKRSCCSNYHARIRMSDPRSNASWQSEKSSSFARHARTGIPHSAPLLIICAMSTLTGYRWRSAAIGRFSKFQCGNRVTSS